jgi:hypothetical protein
LLALVATDTLLLGQICVVVDRRWVVVGHDRQGYRWTGRCRRPVNVGT